MSVVRISPAEVRIGMFIQGFEGPWLDHPFWRTRFVVKDEKALRKIRDSGVEAVLIEAPAAAEPARPAPIGERPAPMSAPLRSIRAAPAIIRAERAPANATASLQQELGRATKTLAQAKRAVTRMFEEARLGKAIRTEHLFPLIEDISGSIERNPVAFLSIAQLRARHEYTYMHSVAVCALMISFARELRLSWTATREAGIAGLFHDIGKAVMPPAILDKPGELDEAEFETIKSHPPRGYELLKGSSGVPGTALDVCLYHHERFDGGGYPEGRSGDRLSIFTRMSAICDVYDAITSQRAYKKAWTPTEAVARMREWDGHFDPEMLDTFLKVLGIYPIGALVRLTSEQLAMVIAANPEDPASPPLLTLDIDGAGAPVAGERLIYGEPIDRIEAPDELGLQDWEPFRNRLIRQFAR